ncbi:MAG: hypothetical protein IPN61_15845 [Bacteroidetes bacterium]|nr:hypothetical protein [Bacteroidota bacterium]MBK9414858.1 hypothetical protein [Bacteroidota bacterium]
MKEIFKRFLQILVFRNYFIAICASAMIFATDVLNNSPVRFTHYNIFITCTTFLLYNFHTYSFKLDYSNFGNLYRSYLKLKISISEQILFTLITIIAIVNVFFLSEKVVLWLFPFGVLSLLFSIPLWGIKRKFRIRESLFVKMPLLAAVWSVTTVIIPLVDQNIDPASPFVIQQTVCRFIFVFILYIPFEIRDMEIDKSENIKTIPSVFGVGRTKISGALLVALEIIIHHLMPVSTLAIYALDLSSLIALAYIFVRVQDRESYFYKLFVDGTMILRFIFLYFAYSMI